MHLKVLEDRSYLVVSRIWYLPKSFKGLPKFHTSDVELSAERKRKQTTVNILKHPCS